MKIEKTLIIIPTYNESENVEGLVQEIFGLYSQDLEILFIDDNSTDGTGEIIDKIVSEGNGKINVIHREKKLGLGTAYITGFKWALTKDYKLIFEMDADFSHRPEYLADFFEEIKDADLVLGSRYVHGINVVNWSLMRILISLSGTFYAKFWTRMRLSDLTGGFKCFRRKVLETIDLDNIKSNGYSFQIEMTYKAWKRGFKIKETPIIFYDRVDGVSKMNKRIALEALVKIPLMVIGEWLHETRRS